MTQRYAGVSEVARLLGTTECSIRHRIARGSIPFIRDDAGRISFDLKDIYRMMEKGRCDPNQKESQNGKASGESVQAR